MAVRAVVIPRVRGGTGGFPRVCGIPRLTYRCVLDITRLVEAWDPRLETWQPEIRLCHLHAIEYVTGKPVHLPSIAQQQIDLRDLGA